MSWGFHFGTSGYPRDPLFEPLGILGISFGTCRISQGLSFGISGYPTDPFFGTLTYPMNILLEPLGILRISFGTSGYPKDHLLKSQDIPWNLNISQESTLGNPCLQSHKVDGLFFSFWSQIWANGGLGDFNLQMRNQILDVANNPRSTMKGPWLPLPRILHCLVPINQTHYFLYGGKESFFPNHCYRPNFFKNDRWKLYYKIWTFQWLLNQTSVHNFIYNWESKQWKWVAFDNMLL